MERNLKIGILTADLSKVIVDVQVIIVVVGLDDRAGLFQTVVRRLEIIRSCKLEIENL